MPIFVVDNSNTSFCMFQQLILEFKSKTGDMLCQLMSSTVKNEKKQRAESFVEMEHQAYKIINNKNRASIKHSLLSIDTDIYSFSTYSLEETLIGTPS